MFRNTHKALKVSPSASHLHPLDVSDEGTSSFEQKIEWLVYWLSEHRDEKSCSSADTGLVEEIYEAVQEQVNLNLSQFHEGLNLIRRDRQAAYFADPEGARVLLCSRSVAKGAFQFAHHLILWDLTENPELVEQRIGRLDRIGQTVQSHSSPFHEDCKKWRFYNQGGVFNRPRIVLSHQFRKKLTGTTLIRTSKALYRT